jgi:hypothetical protein
MSPIYLPGRNDRITILGRTGTGKTVGAIWHLSKKDLRTERWLLVDYKGDDHVALLEDAGAPVISAADKLPKKPGLYIVRPEIGDAKIADFWRAVHRERNTGVFVDEGYMVKDDEAYDALLTQGRSLCIPMIVLSQRPRWVTRFVFSEATFFQVYALNDDDDWRRVAGFVPLPSAWEASRLQAREAGNLAQALNPPPYYSYYYDTNAQSLVRFSPVPPVEESVDAIAQQIKKRRAARVI